MTQLLPLLVCFLWLLAQLARLLRRGDSWTKPSLARRRMGRVSGAEAATIRVAPSTLGQGQLDSLHGNPCKHPAHVQSDNSRYLRVPNLKWRCCPCLIAVSSLLHEVDRLHLTSRIISTAISLSNVILYMVVIPALQRASKDTNQPYTYIIEERIKRKLLHNTKAE